MRKLSIPTSPHARAAWEQLLKEGFRGAIGLHLERVESEHLELGG